MQKNNETVQLSPGELEIMEILWNGKGTTLAETHRVFLDRGKKTAYTTVQTRLNRLVDKGFVRRSDDYPCVYEAVLPKSRISGKYFDLLEELCGGSIAPLMSHLLRKRRFTDEELDSLREVLDRHAEDPKPENGKKGKR